MGKQTYFITGGFGFLGQHIVKAVHDFDQDSEVRVLLRTERDTYVSMQDLARVRLIKGDLLRPEALHVALEGVDTVIHSAALVSFKKSDEGALYDSNVLGTRNLIQAAVKHGCRHFIFISSISAIGSRPPNPSDETMIPDLDEKRHHDPYGYSKLMGELEVQRYASQIRVIILNPSVILGPGSRRIEQIYRWIRYVPVFPMLSTLNSFVDVRDVAHAVILALSAGRSGERYIVNSETVDMLTFAHLVLRILGKRAIVFPISGILIPVADGMVAMLDLLRINPGIRPISALNVNKEYASQKIRSELAWVPAYTLEQSLNDTFAQIWD